MVQTMIHLCCFYVMIIDT